MSRKHKGISHAYFFTPPPQHRSISFTMTLCCCALWWPWLHASCLSVDSVAAGAISIALAFSVALLDLQKTLSCFDGSSSSTHSNKQQPLWIFVSLLQSWNPAAVASVFSCHILQCIILPALQQQQKNHCGSLCCCWIFWHQSMARFHLWKGYFLHMQGNKGVILISVLFVQSYIYLIQQSAIGFDQPLSSRFVKSWQKRLRKNTIHKSVNFHELGHTLICLICLWACKLKILSAGYLLSPIIKKTRLIILTYLLC